MKAFVLIKIKGYAEDEFEKGIVDKYKNYLMKIDGKHPLVCSITGRYDVIVGIEVRDEERLREMLVDIRKSESVYSTETLICL